MKENWAEFDGMCALKGFDPMGSNLGRVLNVAYVMLMKGCENEDEQNNLRNQIYRPVSTSTVIDEDMPSWAVDFIPPWWQGHEAAAYDGRQSALSAMG